MKMLSPTPAEDDKCKFCRNKNYPKVLLWENRRRVIEDDLIDVTIKVVYYESSKCVYTIYSAMHWIVAVPCGKLAVCASFKRFSV